jgi:3,4-dihydroxy 2-butanone 4-phosphate synthase/GTP cyclohydrolase II
VLNRRGQTEGSVDLARIAGLKPSGVICEIMDEKGEMLRGDALQQYCKERKLKITSVEAIKDYRLTNEVSVRKAIETSVDNLNDISVITPSGDVEKISVGPIKIAVYVDDVEGKEHLAFIKGEVRGKECLVRIHSECLTGDVFGSLRCDCGNQFALAMKEIVTAGTGVLIYLHQEGRGIGLANKLRAYELQDQGLDTVDANLQLGFEADARDYRVGAQILAELGIESAILMTNNPAKLQSLKSFGVKTIRRVSLLSMDEHNRAYLLTKRDRMGHVLEE